MRIGTFRCWLWGHKFIAPASKILDDHPGYIRKWKEATNFCIRCGIDKEAVTER